MRARHGVVGYGIEGHALQVQVRIRFPADGQPVRADFLKARILQQIRAFLRRGGAEYPQQHQQRQQKQQRPPSQSVSLHRVTPDIGRSELAFCFH